MLEAGGSGLQPGASCSWVKGRWLPWAVVASSRGSRRTLAASSSSWVALQDPSGGR